MFTHSSSFHHLLQKRFAISARGSTVRTELVAGLTTFLAMVYAVVTVPSILSDAGFSVSSVYIAVCLVTGLGSLVMGLWANLPLAVGCAISMSTFTAYNLVKGEQITVSTALGVIFIVGVVFTLISLTGIRRWLLCNIPQSIALGTGVGIGLFLLFIAARNVDLVVINTHGNLPLTLGKLDSFPIITTLVGLAAIFALENLRVPGSVFFVIIGICITGIALDPEVSYEGVFALPSFSSDHRQFFALNINSALSLMLVPAIFTLIITALFDATSTISAVASQADLYDDEGKIINGSRALTTDSVSSILAGLVGTAPAAVYIESAAGTAVGGRTGLTAVVVGVLFLLLLFVSPIAELVPKYATAPALMYVGLVMLRNVAKMDFTDKVGSLSGLLTAVFIMFTCNIITGIMLGYVTYVVGRLLSGDTERLRPGIVVIAAILVLFYTVN